MCSLINKQTIVLTMLEGKKSPSSMPTLDKVLLDETYTRTLFTFLYQTL